MKLVELSQCLFGYRNRPVVRVDALHVHAGRSLGIFGPNGSGKTTLVRGMTGLLPPQSGQVWREAGLAMGYLQQHRAMELQWPMSGMDAAAMAISARRPLGWLNDATRELRPAMEALGVADLAGAAFAKLSGGQQQRLLLAGALAARPQWLLLDEPTDGLDVRSRQVLLTALRSAAGEGLATVIISHGVEDLVGLCDEVAWLHPAQDAGEPTTVEIVSASELAQHVLQSR